MFQESFKSVKWSFKWGSRVLKSSSLKFERCFMDVSRNSKEFFTGFKGTKCALKGSFKG